jgi:uncharacterized protein YjeT (DUF2065 family)
MSPDIVLSLCLLIPLIYAGLHMMTDPSNAIRVVNKLMADSHRIEASILWGNLFAAPRPIPESLRTRLFLRFAGLAVIVAGLFRLYSL